MGVRWVCGILGITNYIPSSLMPRSAEQFEGAQPSPSGVVDFLRHLHEHAAPVLSWHSIPSATMVASNVKADRVTLPLKRVVHLSSEVVIDSPRDLYSLTEISKSSAERFFDESKALQDYLVSCDVDSNARSVILSGTYSKGELRQATVSYGFSLHGSRGSGELFKVSELEKRHQSMLDAELWTTSIAKIIEAWSIGILTSRKMISISGTDRNRINHCRAAVLRPSPLNPFVPGLRLSFASQKGRDLVLRSLKEREISAEAGECCSDIFRRSVEDDTEIVVNATQDTNLKKLLVDWCLA